MERAINRGSLIRLPFILFIISKLYIYMFLGVINSNNIKLKTRLESEAIWTGYWDAVLTIESSNSVVGVTGFELAVILGDLPKMAIRNKVNGGAWSSWKIWS